MGCSPALCRQGPRLNDTNLAELPRVMTHDLGCGLYRIILKGTKKEVKCGGGIPELRGSLWSRDVETQGDTLVNLKI